MKTKILAMIMLCMMVMSLIGGMPVSAATNLITKNAGFETSTPAGWSTWDKDEFNIDVKVGGTHSGVRCLGGKVIVDKTTEPLTMKYTSSPIVEVNKWYLFSVWVNIPVWKGNSVDGFKLRVTIGSEDRYSENFGMVTNGWQRVSFPVYVTVTNPLLQFTFGKDIEKDSEIYIDDMTFEELDAVYAEKYEKEFSYIAEYGDTKKGVVLEQKLDEIAQAKWTVASNAKAAIEVDKTVKTEGTGSMRIDIPAEDKNISSVQVSMDSGKPTLRTGIEYEVSVWVYIPMEEETKIKSVGMRAETGRIVTGTNASGSNIYSYQVAPTPAIKSTNGEWKRISGVFTPEEGREGSMPVLRFEIAVTDATTVYFDDLKIMQKEVQYPVLQFLKPVKNTAGNDVLLDTKTIGAGAFSLRYDEHVVNPDSVGNTLVAAIYKTETDGTKRLVELKLDTFAENEKELTLSFDGVETPDNTYSVEVMLWDDITQTLSGIKHGTYKLV